ncbi:MAG: hypothetical protein JSS98_00810 [Bacteroidetes bacterium]|nr:hypothetical protein [Bacteroidota bacterium]
MKTLINFFTSVVVISTLIACNEKKVSREEIDNIGKMQLAKNKALLTELQLFLEHAQKCKTEFEIESFADSLPLFRETKIQIFGSEENWKGQLAWLKENGAKEVSFVKPDGGNIGDLPIPFFHRTLVSPYGH